jgi:hypothetical protein
MPNVQSPLYSTDRCTLSLLAHPLRAPGHRLIWRRPCTNPAASLTFYKLTTPQHTYIYLKQSFTAKWIPFINFICIIIPNQGPKSTRKHAVRGRSRCPIWLLARIESRDSLVEQLIPHHTMLFYSSKTDDELPMIDPNPGSKYFYHFQHLVLRSLVFCS